MKDDADETRYFKKTFEESKYLIREGEPGEVAYVIQKGEVEIVKGFVNARHLAFRVKGDVIGEMALLDNRPASASARAMTDVEVVGISREEFQARADAMDPAMRSIMLHLVKRLRDASEEAAKVTDPVAARRLDWKREEF